MANKYKTIIHESMNVLKPFSKYENDSFYLYRERNCKMIINVFLDCILFHLSMGDFKTTNLKKDVVHLSRQLLDVIENDFWDTLKIVDKPLGE